MVIVLVCLMIIDYVTGVGAAFVRKDLQSKKSIQGAIKKIGYMVLLTLAFFLDFLSVYMANSVDLKLPLKGTFAVASCLWLIGTEVISTVENLNTIGVPFPGFLTSAFKKIHDMSGGNKNE
jgi:toxin secretion/phage lysis holin